MLLVGNGRLVTHDSLNPFMEDGCVVINNNRRFRYNIRNES